MYNSRSDEEEYYKVQVLLQIKHSASSISNADKEKKTFFLFFENHMEPLNIMCGQHSELLTLIRVVFSYHSV
jgi:hypothetical protein